MTTLQRKLYELDIKKEEIKQYYEELHQTIRALVQECGIDSYFKAEDGTVYKLVELKGKFVQFEPYTYVRTKREGEVRGTLSMKEAQQAFGA